MSLWRTLRSLVGLREAPLKTPFTTSGDYWETRYKQGGNSGAGSYNRLAQFKADFLNRFVAEHDISSVIEFGAGDGAQLALAKYPAYVGVDVSNTVLEHLRAKFAGNPAFKFLHTSEAGAERADLSLSLDVIYHLVEDEVFETYMKSLFDAALKYVIVYSSDMDKVWQDSHVRHRQFTRWVEAKRPDWMLLERVPNAYPFDPANRGDTSFADFFVYGKRG